MAESACSSLLPPIATLALGILPWQPFMLPSSEIDILDGGLREWDGAVGNIGIVSSPVHARNPLEHSSLMRWMRVEDEDVLLICQTSSVVRRRTMV